ncbi:MAG: SUMF1/EgtB/PvdO family nonheme iron enzyme [Bacteroidota bacterium]
MKTRFLSIFTTVWSFTLLAQDASFESYTQPVPGTELSLEMIAIEGGRFKMGSPKKEEGRETDEGPQHKAEVSSFWMASQEVTWNLYQLFVERSIDDKQPTWDETPEVNLAVDGVSGATTPYVEMSYGMGTDGFPAIGMTQHAASTFCKWLSAMTGQFYRLPTEAEWEYACRAGTKTPHSFGDSLKADAHAAYYENSRYGYAQVGSKSPNPWGLYDMHGNVSEWTLDQYAEDSYTGRKKVMDPLVPTTKKYPTAVRGGSYKSDLKEMRCADRQYSVKKWQRRDPQIPKSIWWLTDAPYVGFRIVRPLDIPAEEDRALYWDE